MYDHLPGEVAVFDYHEICDQLVEQGLQTSPSEIHGCLCGALGAGAPGQPEVGLAALARELDLNLHGELAERAMQLYQVSAAALEDEEFDFHPLLPEDDTDIAERVAALGSWCRGFLAGFAHVAGNKGRPPAAAPEDTDEILKDFAAIAQAGLDEEAEGDEEEMEASFAELVEYLRFAALNVYMDRRAEERGGNYSPGQGQPIH